VDHAGGRSDQPRAPADNSGQITEAKVKDLDRRINRAVAVAGLVLVAIAALFLIGRTPARGAMDNPVPPLVNDPASTELTHSAGYCVSVNLDGEFFGHVGVPADHADAAHLDVLRVSIANSYRLLALQQLDPAKADALREAAESIRVPGDPLTATARYRRRPGKTVNCVCASYYGGDVTGGRNACGGPCSNCYFCG